MCSTPDDVECGQDGHGDLGKKTISDAPFGQAARLNVKAGMRVCGFMLIGKVEGENRSLHTSCGPVPQ